MSYYNNINLESLTFDFYYFLHVCQEKIEVVNAQADLFAEADHFDAPAIAEKKEVLNARYQQLQVSFFFLFVVLIQLVAFLQSTLYSLFDEPLGCKQDSTQAVFVKYCFV